MVQAAPQMQLVSFSSERNEVSGWFSPGSDSGSVDLAKEAYQDALAFCRNDLKGKYFDEICQKSGRSLQDVQSVVLEAKNRYDDSGKKKKEAQKWLRKFSSRLFYYGAVLDTFAQHHPEYVSLAWGAIKFIFQGILNHEELLVQFAKAMVEVGEILPRVELNTFLYPTDRMKAAVSRLYVSIIQFLMDAVKWYSKSSAGRAFSAIVNPFELSIKGTLERINENSRQVDLIANAASRAELRALHQKIDGIMELASNTQSIVNQVHLDMSGQREFVWEANRVKLIEIFSSNPSPAESLKIRLSALRFHQSWDPRAPGMASLIQCMNTWASSPQPSLFIARSGPRGEERTREYAAEVTHFLKSSGHTVIWYFSNRKAYYDCSNTLKNVLEVLFSQIVNLATCPSSQDIHQLRSENFTSPNSTAEWRDAFCKLLKSIPRPLYIIIDSGTLFNQAQDNSSEKNNIEYLNDIITFCQERGCLIKILLITYGKSEMLLGSQPLESMLVTIRQAPFGSSARRGLPIRQLPWFQKKP